uniref:Multidrug resistance-associated protein 1 n=2 Tax=Lygus hesperus TaxID=30085 RepID=A0A0A9YH98_LYGHE
MITAALQTLFLAQYFYKLMFIGMHTRTALISTIYRKALRLSSAARKESTVGEIVNIMSVDAQRFTDITTHLNMLWSAPLQISLALYFLWQILGPSVLAGLAVMIIIIPVNGFIANKMKTLQIKQMKNKDERVKMMNEILSGIKVLKLYAWEPSFEQQVLKIRNKEVKVMREAAYFGAATSFIWSCAPFLVSLVTFAVYVLVDEKNVLDAKTAFVSLSLFNLLRFPLSMLPMMISNLVQVGVSVKRVNKFMNSEELDPDAVTHNSNEKDPIVIENGSFTWDKEETTLKNINLRIKPKSLVAVVGVVGSGKSSLVSALMGEMEKISGRVNVNGEVAYVPQTAWIQNNTLQDNILFGKTMHRKNYLQVVEACALKQDFDMLPGGDQTEIGEKGINLSGGQKQRVSLARAVYCDADIYYLDDPLSAVDSHVGKHIFDNVIGPKGLLHNKTRVFITHGITHLHEVDLIITLKDGEVSEMGTYQELLDNKGAFAEFLSQHLQEVGKEELEELDEEVKKQLLEVSPEKLSRQLSTASDRSNSISSKHNGGSQKSLDDLIKKSNKAKDKLIEEERAETGGVKLDVYKHYLGAIGPSSSLPLSC